MQGLRAYVARSLADLSARVDTIERAVYNTPTADMVRAEIDEALLKIERTAPTPITVEDIRPILEAETSKWALDFERRAQMVLERAVDRIPAPRDGVDGKDGTPGGGVEDFDIALDGRILTVTMRIGDRVETRTIKLGMPLDKGIFKSGEPYERGDMVTFGGSVFVAQRDTTGSEKPEASPAWRLMVKRGRDGKDAE